MSKLINENKSESNVFESLTNKDCGKYYKKLQLWEKALEILEKAYQQNPSDKSLLLEKSQCQIELTQIYEALSDLNEFNSKNFTVKEKKIECLYQLNKFEDSFKLNFNTLCDNPAKSRDYFENAKIFIRQTLDQSIGRLGKFLFFFLNFRIILGKVRKGGYKFPIPESSGLTHVQERGCALDGHL